MVQKQVKNKSLFLGFAIGIDLYTGCANKKQSLWCLIITLVNAEQFSKFFYQLIHKKILYVYTTKNSTSPAISCYITL